MRLVRAVRRKFGIAAPRMSIRTHVPWYWRWLFVVSAFAVGLALAWWMYDIGNALTGLDHRETRQELADLRERLSKLQRETGKFEAEAVVAKRQVEVEVATQRELAKSAKALQDENARLKEDITFFRNLMSTDGKAGSSVRLYRFKVEHSGFPNEYHYQSLFLQSGTRGQDFQGRVRFLANTLQKGKKIVMPIASAGSNNALDVALDFKYYQRVEGIFQVAPGTEVKSVEVRVFEKGALQPLFTQTVNIS